MPHLGFHIFQKYSSKNNFDLLYPEKVFSSLITPLDKPWFVVNN
jgi:hypothetical protein